MIQDSQKSFDSVRFVTVPLDTNSDMWAPVEIRIFRLD